MVRFDPPSPYELTGPIITAQFDCAYEVKRTESAQPLRCRAVPNSNVIREESRVRTGVG